MSRASWSGALVLALGLMAMPGLHAAPVVFTGVDAGAGPGDPRPTSDAAASNFDSAAGTLGTVSIIAFETAPLGPFSSLTVAPGVMLAGTGDEIANGPLFGGGLPPVIATGYNTTSGGHRFVQTSFSETGPSGPVTFIFSTPSVAFGVYLTGVQVDDGTINFNDGSSRSVHIPNPGGGNGGVEFVGFTDGGKTFSSVTIDVLNSVGTQDEIGVDDVRVVTPTGSGCPSGTAGPNCSPIRVPEPPSLPLVLLALLLISGVGVIRRSFRLPAGAPVKKLIGAVISIAGLIAIPVKTVRADVIYSDLGPGNSFSTTQGWTVNAPGAVLILGNDNAFEFTAAHTDAVTQIDVALGITSGTGAFVVSLWTNSSGFPGTELGHWNVTGVITPPMNIAELVTIGGITGVDVISGVQYFLQVDPGAADTFGSTAWNDRGVMGRTCNVTQGHCSNDETLGAFDIIGGPVVPEPTSLALLGIALAGIGLAKRRKLSWQQETRKKTTTTKTKPEL